MQVRRAALLLVLIAPVLADEESALYFLGRGREALEAGDLDRARDFLQKSLGEKEGFPPALVGLAEVANRQGNSEEAIRYVEACLAQRGRNDLTRAERDAMADAEKLLAEVDEARAEFDKLVKDHIEDLRRLARTTKDTELAAECWRTILVLDPSHAEARDELARATAAAAPPPAGKPLFDGKDLDGWTGGPPVWTVEGGVLRGRIAGGANVNRTERSVKGDFALACEVRVKKDAGDNPLFGILFGVRGSYDHFGLWIWPESWRLERQFEEYRRSDLQRHTFKRLSEKFSRADWHMYRIEVKGKHITCFMDDQQLFEFSGPDRELDGCVGLWVQDQDVEIRQFLLDQ